MDESVRAGALQGFHGLVRDLGGDPEPLIRQSGLDPEALRDPEAMVSLPAVALLLEHAAQRHGCPTFGLRLGSRQDPEVLGLLAVVVQDTATVAEALRTVSRYLFVHSPSYELALEDPSRQLPGCVTLRFDVSLATGVPQRQLLDGFLASALRIARALVPAELRPRGVSVPHTPTGRPEEYRERFGANVFFAQPYAGLHFGREVLTASIRESQPRLREQAVAHLAARQPPAGHGVSARVRDALKSTIGVNRGTKAEIAALLGLHPRTLQRRLSDEGVTFEQIRTEVYRAATWRLLRETRIPLSHTAAALGFSEQSALSRSVRRWFGSTPSLIRAQVSGNAGAATFRRPGDAPR
ncbi:AraC family transcriptional regulator [Crossiella sp. CA-258035]|uniref:AraC family transcriptional regulator n=1 Tax=Crossiella sp. CA-258035 TaxID=2981138 RepID=UPI0024BC7D1C|nr:AraC family transcriptional regulator [Crossiella sp. CA-258035]WHT16575.1 AraC family transcriptional regulator [Crossiella sp. CA-258035]